MFHPVISTLRYFRDEFEAHIKDKRCPACVCPALIEYIINSESCKGCTLCSRACPQHAVSGEKKKPHEIDSGKCIKCGACIEVCKFGAIIRRSEGVA